MTGWCTHLLRRIEGRHGRILYLHFAPYWQDPCVPFQFLQGCPPPFPLPHMADSLPPRQRSCWANPPLAVPPSFCPSTHGSTNPAPPPRFTVHLTSRVDWSNGPSAQVALWRLLSRHRQALERRPQRGGRKTAKDTEEESRGRGVRGGGSRWWRRSRTHRKRKAAEIEGKNKKGSFPGESQEKGWERGHVVKLPRWADGVLLSPGHADSWWRWSRSVGFPPLPCVFPWP